MVRPAILLRVRVGDITVVLDQLDPVEELVARSSPGGLEIVASRHLDAVGCEVFGQEPKQ
jgi:hypothetical protein